MIVRSILRMRISLGTLENINWRLQFNLLEPERNYDSLIVGKVHILELNYNGDFETI